MWGRKKRKSGTSATPKRAASVDPSAVVDESVQPSAQAGSGRPAEPPETISTKKLDRAGWRLALQRAWTGFNADHCTDLAAALTYYSVLSIFPALVALVSLLGVFGQGESTVNAMLDIVRNMGQASAADTLRGPIESMVNTRGAGIGLVVGILGALWSASGYVGGFGRAMNRIFGVTEGRPVWKLRPVNLLVTLVLVVMVALILLGLVLSGGIAQSVGDAIGLGSVAVTVWSIAKWPVMLLILVVMVALLYWATPNVRQPKLHFLSPGAVIAIVTAVVATAGFGIYVSHFGSYDKTYGSLAGVVVSLLWIWLINVALMLGAEFDVEIERVRQLSSGVAAEEVLQLPVRDAKGSVKRADKRARLVDESRDLRLEADTVSSDAAGSDAPASSRRGASSTEGRR